MDTERQLALCPTFPDRPARPLPCSQSYAHLRSVTTFPRVPTRSNSPVKLPPKCSFDLPTPARDPADRMCGLAPV